MERYMNYKGYTIWRSRIGVYGDKFVYGISDDLFEPSFLPFSSLAQVKEIINERAGA